MVFSIQERDHFYRTLSKSLTDEGRLVLLRYKNYINFVLSNISNMDGLITELSTGKTGDQLDVFFKESTRALAKGLADDIERGALKKHIVDDLNAAVKNPCLLGNFINTEDVLAASLDFNAEEREFVDWAMRVLINDEVLDGRKCLDIDSPDMRQMHVFLMRVINSALIVQKLRPFLFHRQPAPYLPGGLDRGDAQTIISEFSQMGYKLRNVYDFIPFEIIYEFSLDKKSQ